MSEQRCPNCGALVGAEAEWCGQCLQPLRSGREPAPPPDTGAGGPAAGPRPPPVSPDEAEESLGPPGAEGPTGPPEAEPRPAEAEATGDGVGEGEPRRVRRGAFEQVGDRMVWTCPTCELENSIDVSVCERCGTSFANLFREPEVRPAVPATRAAGLSLLFPGVGHIAAGQIAEGVARAILFTWALGSTIGLVLVGGDGSSGIYVPFLLLYALATAALYVVSAMDAYRAALSVPPLAPIRVLFYGASGLMAVTVAVLLFTGFSRGGG